jgi:hypothetical protein
VIRGPEIAPGAPAWQMKPVAVRLQPDGTFRLPRPVNIPQGQFEIEVYAGGNINGQYVPLERIAGDGPPMPVGQNDAPPRKYQYDTNKLKGKGVNLQIEIY